MVIPKKSKSAAAHSPTYQVNLFDSASFIGIDKEAMDALAHTENTGATSYNGIDLTPYTTNPNTATVVVSYYLSPNEIRHFVCTIFYDKDTQKAWHAWAMQDLIEQLDPSTIDQLVHGRLHTADVLMQSIKEHISVGPESIVYKMLPFTRFVTSLLGMGIFVFDTTNPSAIPVTYSSSQLDQFLALTDPKKLEFVGLPFDFRKGRSSKD